MESSTGRASICRSTGLASNGLKSPCSVAVGGFLAGGEVTAGVCQKHTLHYKNPRNIVKV